MNHSIASIDIIQTIQHIKTRNFTDSLTPRTLEALLQVRLHSERVLGLRENLQHLIIGQEEEPGEEQPLLLQVGVQTPVDAVQHAVTLGEALQEAYNARRGQNVRVLLDLVHHALPVLVHLLLVTGVRNNDKAEQWAAIKAPRGK